jgi:FMN reductase
MTKLAIISGGLREPSSTRLLADRITTAVEAALAGRNLAGLRPIPTGMPVGVAGGFGSDGMKTLVETCRSGV